MKWIRRLLLVVLLVVVWPWTRCPICGQRVFAPRDLEAHHLGHLSEVVADHEAHWPHGPTT